MGTNTTIPPRTPTKSNADSSVVNPSTPAPSGNTPHHEHSMNTPSMRKQRDFLLNENYKLDVSRSVLNNDLGPSVPEVSFEFFQDYVFPPLHCDISIPAVMKNLEVAGVISTDTGRWREFGQDPADIAKEKKKEAQAAKRKSDDSENVNKDKDDGEALENRVFGRLTQIIPAIIAHSGATVAPTLEYLSMPNGVPISVNDGKANKPDGHFVFTDREAPIAMKDKHRLYWRDFCAPAEFKLNDGPQDITDDNVKICWNMYQIMREDPRRRFLFAFTIQNTSMRVWFASRSEVFVSEPFNFIQEKEKLVHFVLALSYAEHHQLGIDPTMKVVNTLSSGRLVYDMTVRDQESGVERVFRTRDLINDDGTGELRGRGTRVWEVYEVVDGVVQEIGSPIVLKDSWIDVDRKREGAIVEEIRKSYEGSDEHDVFEKTFLSVVCHGDVYIDQDKDTTRNLMTRGAIPPKYPRFTLRRASSDEPTSINDVSDITSLQDGQDGVRTTIPSQLLEKIVEYFPKQHYRIVFLELCKPLSKENSLSKVFGHLAGCVAAVALLHNSKPAWVHRDLSPGNILIDSAEQTRLADLEYAKQLHDNGPSHDIRTGTVNFMAVEVDAEKYLFLPQKKVDIPKDTEDSASAQAASGSFKALMSRWRTRQLDTNSAPSKAAQLQLTAKNHVFRHNTLHDLESLLWIAINFVTNKERRLLDDPDDTSLALTAADRKNAGQLFYDRNARVVAMVTEGLIESTLRSLPTPLLGVGARLIELKQSLTGRYKHIEGDPTLIGADQDPVGDLYIAFMDGFDDIAIDLRQIGDVFVTPIKLVIPVSQQAPARTGSKRRAANELGSRSKKQKSSQTALKL